MKPKISKHGYLEVTLMLCGKSSYRRVHQLVAEAFIPNPENKPIINHKDGNKLNNNVENLEWCTYKENLMHAYRTKLRKDSYTIYCAELDKTFYSMHEAARELNTDYRNIWNCCNGVMKQTKGYHIELRGTQ